MAVGDTFRLRLLTADRLNEVATDWIGHAGVEEFEVELGNFFDWCSTHLEESGDGYALELFNVTQGKTDAILDVNEGRRGAMTKLLRMHLSPEFWPIDINDADVIVIHANAYSRFITQGITGGATEVKIYGRSDVMLTMLESLERVWVSHDTGTAAKLQGRWLSITPIQP